MNYIFNSPGALNSELPAGCARTPVFEHAPSSPTVYTPLQLVNIVNRSRPRLTSCLLKKTDKAPV